jgi:hypothetical protein
VRYFLFGRPFRYLPTSGLYFLLLGEGIILATNTMRQCRQAWPTEPVSWLLWLLAVGALGLLALVVQAAAREYAGRADRPHRFWQVPRLLNIGSGEQKVEPESRP